MSHIHIPDGTLPLWLWISGFIIVAVYLIITYFCIKKSHPGKKNALVGILSALMLVTMSIEIPFIPYHLNLAALTGIILGPHLSVLSVFVVNIILAFLGHGGITVIGLNTVVISIEAISGYFIFNFLKRHNKSVFLSALIATFVALMISASATVSIVYSGTQKPQLMLEHNEDKHSPQKQEPFDIKKFIEFIFTVGIVGWTFEALITAFIVNYINKIKPDILEIGEKEHENF